MARIIEAVMEMDWRHMKTWMSAPRWLRQYEDEIDRGWTPERDEVAALMQREGDERASGISGIDPLYFAVKSFHIYRGRQAMEINAKRGAAR